MSPNLTPDLVRGHFFRTAGILQRLADSDHSVANLILAATAMVKARMIFACGNGGSAADAQHFAAELVPHKIAAMALTTDSSVITAIANDFGYDRVFADQLVAYGQKGDVLLAISTSGRSQNVLKAIEKARELEMIVVALVGDQNNRPFEADLKIKVPFVDIETTQEVFVSVEHVLASLVIQFRESAV